jgi:hypothetical protein
MGPSNSQGTISQVPPVRGVVQYRAWSPDAIGGAEPRPMEAGSGALDAALYVDETGQVEGRLHAGGCTSTG